MSAMSRANEPVSTTPTYRSWKAMRDRCTNAKNVKFRYYGGRGIKVCARWMSSFYAFREDMGERPIGKTLDRFPNNNGDYEPGNCRWATKAEQTSTQRRRTSSLVRRMPENLMDRKFGRLLVTGYQGIKNRKAYWLCQCVCGKKAIVGAAALKRARTKSCGCLRKDVAVFNLPESRA